MLFCSQTIHSIKFLQIVHCSMSTTYPLHLFRTSYVVHVPKLLELVALKLREVLSREPTLLVMVVGVPNVGKSALINSIHQIASSRFPGKIMVDVTGVNSCCLLIEKNK